MGSGTSTRFPRSVFGRGDEPDPRFTLANERTFLAWIRTALALMAAGVALESLALGIQAGLRLAASVLLILLGLVAAAQAWFGWAGDERALRRSGPLQAPLLALPLAVGVAVAGVLVLAGVVVGG